MKGCRKSLGFDSQRGREQLHPRHGQHPPHQLRRLLCPGLAWAHAPRQHRQRLPVLPLPRRGPGRNGDGRVYRWSDGTVVDYARWAPGEPNDAGSFGRESCVNIYNRHVDPASVTGPVSVPGPFSARTAEPLQGTGTTPAATVPRPSFAKGSLAASPRRPPRPQPTHLPSATAPLDGPNLVSFFTSQYGNVGSFGLADNRCFIYHTQPKLTHDEALAQCQNGSRASLASIRNPLDQGSLILPSQISRTQR